MKLIKNNIGVILFYMIVTVFTLLYVDKVKELEVEKNISSQQLVFEVNNK